MNFKNSCDGAYDSVDVRFNKACDNDCAFCIEKEGLHSLGKTDVNELVVSTLRSGIKNVLILGGEPFLEPVKLLMFVSRIRKHVGTIYVTTSLPKVFLTRQLACLDVLNKIDGLNVSVHSVDSDENNDIFQASSRHNRLEILAGLNRTHGHKIRTSINLVKGGIHNEERLTVALAFLQSIGCQHVKVNELQHAAQLYVSYEDIMGKHLPSPYAHGCQTVIEEGDKWKVTLKRSCFLVENSRKASIADLGKVLINKFRKPLNKFQVLYEDGSSASTWLKERPC
jgi:molybdenum cofactor biosynthesis enzyme MoaA